MAPRVIWHGFYEAGITSSRISHVLRSTLDSLPFGVKPAGQTYRWSISGKLITSNAVPKEWQAFEEKKSIYYDERVENIHNTNMKQKTIKNKKERPSSSKITFSDSKLSNLTTNENTGDNTDTYDISCSTDFESDPTDSQEGEENILVVRVFGRKNKQKRLILCPSDHLDEPDGRKQVTDLSSSSNYSEDESSETDYHSDRLNKSKEKRKRDLDSSEYIEDDLSSSNEEEDSDEKKLSKKYSMRSEKCLPKRLSEHYVLFTDSDESENNPKK
ncbi:uncharacterized protein MONOS_14386 [Monocercomonoides exilis]|uniref:uncharacterized protein n=1 Tax=Monocercomonoides exilis TaxID=2049356 RepID=UPI0035593C6F|nr:hypothetical protein MONOS_14386 [Monocercomonoides exilis]|eukprot:MONOS_14386.1-p1 / transcript=MONOS_14386.1 / gene=MONOS_14386 / organism=Monocercomonoides_exilis_PA203 / gene_product=unspecified product / transcript_product=unspecified product / location=Mono_scaffold00993:16863-17678(-) / protein_length=272 / sequence_SO=supercontig / SO=protein_coding / is_pseudo=false